MKSEKHFFLVLIVFGAFQIALGQNYKFITYNIRYDNPNDGENQWSKRKAFLCQQLAFYKPDVFGIQEGLQHQVQYIDSTLLDYNYIGVGRNDGKTKGEYSAIFYNSDKLQVINSNTFWLSETPQGISVGWDASMERICTYALFEDIDTKQQFWVFNTHFDHRGLKAREESAKLIVKKVNALNQNNLPVILMGDFNLKPDSVSIAYLSGIFNDTKEVSQSKPFGPEGTFNGFKFKKPVKNRIDYIFVSKDNIKVNKYAVLSDSKDCKYPSDHLPVFVAVQFNKL
ncbi:endonuclease/exonuclease/phosphatase family protein [Snuella sedimenti]|uniref:Endonuclease/exonuclease/phosphatase family protein n=1 Tax=Snuella sedimenti TaxID=2798802 RepID=A0A8J7IF57_9FLAO|nr:endonuclease/exonuclease/phosphatase family protein [Snuella sedimenti]MBJ6367427.1 endonuclease/exonuclease/phosphatase family protein [Snuella sedimenti]